MNWKGFGEIVWVWVAARAREKTTWVGIVSAGAILFGNTLAPERADQIATLVAGVASLLLITSKSGQ